MFSPTKTQKENLWTGAVLFLYGLWMLVHSFSFTGVGRAGEPGPVLLPRIISTLLILLSILLLLTTVAGLKKADKSIAIATEEKIKSSFLDKKNINILITFGLFVFYMLALAPLGFVLSSIIYVFLQMLVLSVAPSKKQLLIFAIVSISVPILSYLLFVNAFSLMLPRGDIW